MSPCRKTMPSFTLVLTSGHPSLHSSANQMSPATLPTAPDFLMKTMRYHSTDNELIEDRDDDVESQTTFEAAKPASFDHVAEQTSANPFKRRLLFLIQKLLSYKREFVGDKSGLV